MTSIQPHRDRLYTVWRTIKRRCYDPSYKDYPHYGGRHITMCKEWRDNFESFYQWALKTGYRPGLTVDRVCNTRGYNPGNCRWASRKQQANNRTTNTHLKMDGKSMTISQWAELTGIPDYAIIRRMERGGSVKKSLTTPLQSRKD